MENINTTPDNGSTMATPFGGDTATQCAVFDQAPNTDQYKVNIIVRPAHTVGKMMGNIGAQFQYNRFDLLLQPNEGGEVVHLNKHKERLVYDVAGFVPYVRNNLVLLPNGMWHGDVKKRFDLDAAAQPPAATAAAVESPRTPQTALSPALASPKLPASKAPEKTSLTEASPTKSSSSSSALKPAAQADLVPAAAAPAESSATSPTTPAAETVPASSPATTKETTSPPPATPAEAATPAKATTPAETCTSPPAAVATPPETPATSPSKAKPAKTATSPSGTTSPPSTPEKTPEKTAVKKVKKSSATSSSSSKTTSTTSTQSTKKEMKMSATTMTTTTSSTAASSSSSTTRITKKTSTAAAATASATTTSTNATATTAAAQNTESNSTAHPLSRSVGLRSATGTSLINSMSSSSSMSTLVQSSTTSSISTNSSSCSTLSAVASASNITSINGSSNDSGDMANNIKSSSIGAIDIAATKKSTSNSAGDLNVKKDISTAISDNKSSTIENHVSSSANVEVELTPTRLTNDESPSGGEKAAAAITTNGILAIVGEDQTSSLASPTAGLTVRTNLGLVTATTSPVSNGNNTISHSNSASGSNLTSPPSTMTTVTEPIHTSGSNSLNLSPMSDQDQMSDDDLALGASASPTETDPMHGSCIGGPLGALANTSPSSTSMKYGGDGVDLAGDGDISAASSGSAAGIMNEEELHKLFCAKTGYRNEHDGTSSYERRRALAKLPAPVRPTSATTTTTTTTAAAGLPSTLSTSSSASATTSSAAPSNAYVGLVNQAMTCYLNSLLQALYMTPEFRNALYRWEFDNDTEAKNIPYQLQKLFLNLQTSKKSAVETTDLTRSFGWDSTEAWQQHDIQELCRVMFDALEHKFKNTKQANLISNLYEGRMIDYVKCLECQTEKTRSDTFLDIPLPVRPFGSTVAYDSIEEALRAFVQPETLDGNNQYFCEKCDKKCDAHKGLKFENFPYVLTLHLKRFDFDYQTMHRIKLNDKVTFPQTLNLNTFVNAADAQTLANLPATTKTTPTTNGELANGGASGGNGVLDDCSTTDSGSATEEDNYSSGIVTTANSSQHENDMNDDDEGIDMSTSTADHARPGSLNANVVQQRLKHESGPYIYELFAIMIHSGSASGGHYYAYIKEFENGEWFCFNDQTVSPITQDDIQRSFGGGVTKAYYSSVYSSSINAYMLMYRQIDPRRNEHAMTPSNLPDHINALLPRLQSDEESRYAGRHLPSRHTTAVSDLALPELLKPRVYFYNPALKKLKMTRAYVSHSFYLNSVLESAYQNLNVERFAPLSRCRLVACNQLAEQILYSFDDPQEAISPEVRSSKYAALDFLLEYSGDGQTLDKYVAGGSTWNVYMVNLSTMEMEGPFLVYCSTPSSENTEALRQAIAIRLHINGEQALVATIRNNVAFVSYDPAPSVAAQQHLEQVAKTKFNSLTFLYLYVPSTDAKALEMHGIPSYEPVTTPTTTHNGMSNGCMAAGVDVVDACRMNGISLAGAAVGAGEMRRESPLPPHGVDSNSEDSSLSDGDRTLVESLPSQRLAGGGDSQVSSTNHSPQLSSPEYEATATAAPPSSTNAAGASSQQQQDYNNLYERFLAGDIASEMAAETWRRQQGLFFYASKVDCADGVSLMASLGGGGSSQRLGGGGDEAARSPASGYKLLLDTHMRMDTMKAHIARLIRVPCNYFQLKRKHDSAELQEPKNTVNHLIEADQLYIELGKLLQKEEHRAAICFMRLSELNDETRRLTALCDWVYTNGLTVLEAKRELIAKLQRLDAEKYETLSLANCRLWLKSGRCPIKVLMDEETLGHALRYSTGTEFLLQQCEPGVKAQTSDNSLTIFVRRWHADKLLLDGFQEITLEKDSELRSVLAALSDIPEEHIAYTKGNGSFPCTNISLLKINSMNWLAIPTTIDKHPLSTSSCGNVFFYKDARTASRELSPLERRELNDKENKRLERIGGTCSSGMSLASPRRERALKIYVDSSPESVSAPTLDSPTPSTRTRPDTNGSSTTPTTETAKVKN